LPCAHQTACADALARRGELKLSAQSESSMWLANFVILRQKMNFIPRHLAYFVVKKSRALAIIRLDLWLQKLAE